MCRRALSRSWSSFHPNSFSLVDPYLPPHLPCDRPHAVHLPPPLKSAPEILAQPSPLVGLLWRCPAWLGICKVEPLTCFTGDRPSPSVPQVCSSVAVRALLYGSASCAISHPGYLSEERVLRRLDRAARGLARDGSNIDSLLFVGGYGRKTQRSP